MSTWSFMSTRGQGHSLIGPNHTDSIFLNVFSSITTDFNISSALSWPIQDQWSSGFNLSLHIVSKYKALTLFKRNKLKHYYEMPEHDKTVIMTCAPSLIWLDSSLFIWILKLFVHVCLLCAAKTLIRLSGWPGYEPAQFSMIFGPVQALYNPWLKDEHAQLSGTGFFRFRARSRSMI